MEKVIYVGAVELSQHGLDELIQRGIKPELVVTLRPDLSRRHSDFVDIGALAADHDIPVLRVNNINEPDNLDRIRQLAPDYIFIIGWSQLIKPELLAMPGQSCIGFHFAKLPRNRGRAAIPWVILNQETETGVTLMHLDDGVDSGDIALQRTIPLLPDEKSGTLYAKVCAGLRDMMGETARLLLAGEKLPRHPQDHAQATYLAKRTADDGHIDRSRPAVEIERLIRAVGKPYPGAFTFYKDLPLVIWEARLRPSHNHIGTIGQILERGQDSVIVQCGEGWIELLTVEHETTGDPVPAPALFSASQERLGLDVVMLWRKLQTLSKRIEEQS